MGTEHTPGPWTAHKSTIGEYWYDITARANLDWDGASEMWSNDPASANGDNDEEALANALLVAAAPDLLAACQRADEWIRSGYDGEAAYILDELCIAIAKATRKESPDDQTT